MKTEKTEQGREELGREVVRKYSDLLDSPDSPEPFSYGKFLDNPVPMEITELIPFLKEYFDREKYDSRRLSLIGGDFRLKILDNSEKELGVSYSDYLYVDVQGYKDSRRHHLKLMGGMTIDYPDMNSTIIK
jgi:hypothetical protein